jgi:nicotinamide-nucleotide amidase
MIERYGAVSAEVAATMAAAMCEASDADIALSVTGLAGPGGGTPEKPIGLVYLALADAAGTYTEEARFSGDRVKIRNRAAKRALNKLRIYLLDRKQTNG